MDTLIFLRDTITANVVKVVDSCQPCFQEAETNCKDIAIVAIICVTIFFIAIAAITAYYCLKKEEYDATKEEPISRSLPCKKLIETMELRQLEADGFFFDKDGKLAAFDTNLTQKIDSVVVRKDILDSFISQSGLKLVWLVDAKKEIHSGDYSHGNQSDWEAVFTYEENHITGDINRLPGEITGQLFDI